MNSDFPRRKNKKKSIRTKQESLVLCTVPNQFALQMPFKTLNSCYVQLKHFAMCIMHATCYSNERFSAFQTYILPLQYELNLNLFLYLNKIYNHDCCQVKPFEFVSLFLIRSTIIIIVKLNHRLYIIFIAHHMITVELDMNYVYYMNSNSIFRIHFMLISNHSTFQALARSS